MRHWNVVIKDEFSNILHAESFTHENEGLSRILATEFIDAAMVLHKGCQIDCHSEIKEDRRND